MMNEIHPSYDLYQLFFSTSDTGHAGAARDRTYVIASRIDATSCKLDPFDLKEAISHRMRCKVRTQPKDYAIADPVEITADAMTLANKRMLEWRPQQHETLDLRGLLTKRERQALHAYEQEYARRYQKRPCDDANLVLFLGDSPSYSLTWSAVSRRIPTLRCNSSTGKLWLPSKSRWLVARERMAWPVHSDLAQAMGCPSIPVRDLARAAELLGNGMHFTTVAVAPLPGMTPSTSLSSSVRNCLCLNYILVLRVVSFCVPAQARCPSRRRQRRKPASLGTDRRTRFSWRRHLKIRTKTARLVLIHHQGCGF